MNKITLTIEYQFRNDRQGVYAFRSLRKKLQQWKNYWEIDDMTGKTKINFKIT